ncbi:MAG: ABC transporter ATP-binding protein [Deltaproteobacteria bacterium]|nr:ABC transporter ATP-binding protein [Deltaproteobacteria bacterium]
MEKAIDVIDVCKMFRLYRERSGMLKEAFINLFRGGDKYDEFWALRGVSFSVQRGESLGIIGRNGAGKSTIFKLISGVLAPNRGEIKVRGRISPLVELEAGLHPELTGLENIYLNGAIYGMSRKEMEEKLDEIIEFSGLGKFIHSPIRTYSSGMHARLGFSVAINVDADILLIDEVLAVGDAEFREGCYDKIKQLKRNGVTIVYVSHNLKSVVDLCDRAIWLDRGEIRIEGNPQEVVEEYVKIV